MPSWVMVLPKRIEIWLLLAAVLAGLVFVFSSRSPDGELVGSGGAAGPEAAGGEETLRVHRCVLERDYGNARLDIDLRVRNAAAEKVVLQSPRARLVTGKGREVPSFFLPFEAMPEVPGGATRDVQLRFWLEAADLGEALRLEVDGRSVEVKGGKAFDLQAMKTGEKRILAPGEW